MPAYDDESFKLKLAQDVGYIRGTVNSLDSKIDSITRKVDLLEATFNGKISLLHQNIGGLVRREDCKMHMSEVEQAVGGALAVASQARDHTQKIPRGNEDGIKKLWEKIAANSRDLAAILALLGMIGAAIITLSHYISKIENTIAVADEIYKKQQAELKREQKEIKRIIRVWTIDAGVIQNKD